MTTKYLDFLYSLCFATALTIISFILGKVWNVPMTWLDLFAVWTSFSCTWLCVTQNTIAFPIGIASTIAYGISFWGYGLISSSISSYYLIPVQMVGWWYWWKGKDKVSPARPSNNYEATVVKEEVPVTHLKFNLNQLAFYGGTSVVSWGALWFLTNAIGATLPMYDSAILVMSIVAQYLMQGKKIENWYVWIFMNCIAIYTYFTTGAFLFGVQYIFFILTDIMGLIQWWISMKNTKENIDA